MVLRAGTLAPLLVLRRLVAILARLEASLGLARLTKLHGLFHLSIVSTGILPSPPGVQAEHCRLNLLIPFLAASSEEYD